MSDPITGGRRATNAPRDQSFNAPPDAGGDAAGVSVRPRNKSRRGDVYEVEKPVQLARRSRPARVIRRPSETPNTKPIGGHQGMRRVGSESPADENVVLRETEKEPARVLPEPTPAEEPGVFVEQPFERWSPRDLVVGLARLVRSTGAAIVRGTAAP